MEPVRVNYLGQPDYSSVGKLWFDTLVWPKAVAGSVGTRVINNNKNQ